MTKILCEVVVFVVLSTSAIARAELLMSEGFEGPYNFKYYANASTLVTIPNFAGPGFNAPYADNKWDLAKETSGCKSGSQCIRVCNEYAGGTCEFHANEINPPRDELWVTYWEKLSSSYDINFGHKWFTFTAGSNVTPFSYVNWQAWDSAAPNILSSRVYNSGTWACPAPQDTFATTTGVTLPLNEWYQWKIHIKLNTPGVANGAWQVWVKKAGVWYNVWNLTNSQHVRCGGGTNNIKDVWFNGTRVNSLGPASYGPKWIDDIKIGTTEADVDNGGGVNSLSAPTSLRVVN